MNTVRSTLSRALNEARERDPVTAAKLVARLAATEPAAGEFAAALGDALIASTTAGFEPSAFDEVLLDHLETLGPRGDAERVRVIRRADSTAVIESALERERRHLGSLGRVHFRLARVYRGPQAERLVGDLLEDAMRADFAWQRRAWTAFVHTVPAHRAAAERLVWASHHHDRVTLFRVSAEGEVLDDDDEPLSLPDDAVIRIPHTLDFDRAAVNRWGKIFAEYDIVSSFAQLDRPIAEPSESSAGRDAIPIHRGASLGQVVRHFVRRGWAIRRRGSRAFFDIQLARDVTATLNWWPSGEDHAHLLELYFSERGENPLFLGDVPKRAYSEALLALSEFSATTS